MRIKQKKPALFSLPFISSISSISNSNQSNANPSNISNPNISNSNISNPSNTPNHSSEKRPSGRLLRSFTCLLLTLCLSFPVGALSFAELPTIDAPRRLSGQGSGRLPELETILSEPAHAGKAVFTAPPEENDPPGESLPQETDLPAQDPASDVPQTTPPPSVDAPSEDSPLSPDTPAPDTPGPEAPGSEDDLPLPEAPDPDPSLPQKIPDAAPRSELQEAVSYYVVSYYMAEDRVVTESVAAGNSPKKVPNPVVEGYDFIGWYTQEDTLVNPINYVVTTDISFYAKYERHLDMLLNTEEHLVYAGGYANGLFKPDKNISRGEVAQLFYALLRNKDGKEVSFPDVSTNDWFYKPVSVLAGLGVIGGYEDGTFGPLAGISRAEFVTMAVKFDTLGEYEPVFSDVPETYWASAYIATAARNHWLSGYQDGSFRPTNILTRGEALAVINGMLGRQNPSAVAHFQEAKNFYDVFRSHWAYGHITEATTVHSYTRNAEGIEVWSDFEKDPPLSAGFWINDGDIRYYIDPATKKLASGYHVIDGVSYYFDPATHLLYTGFQTVGGWKRYFKDGLMQEDISGLGVVGGPYYIKVYKNNNYLIVFARDGDGQYNIPVKAMITSCGYGTPTGTYYTPNRYRWLRMEGYTWAQWCTQISGNYLFHSVPNWTYSNMDLEVEEYNLLGSTRSMGCIRLRCVDAKWMFDNCVLGTQVYISPSETSGPLNKPTSLKLPAWHTWDPTDPTAYYRCQQIGCH